MTNKNNIATLWKNEEYTIVPSALYQRCKRLNEATALFYCRLMDDYLNETKNYGKEYYPRLKELAIKFRVDEKTIKSRLKILAELGLVIQTPNKGYANFMEVINFQELDILDDTDVKEEIAIHRGQRRVERKQQQQEWLSKQLPPAPTPEPLPEPPQEPEAPEAIQPQPEPEKTPQALPESVIRPPVTVQCEVRSFSCLSDAVREVENLTSYTLKEERPALMKELITTKKVLIGTILIRVE